MRVSVMVNFQLLWPMAWMRDNYTRTWKYYGKPTQIKMRTQEVLRKKCQTTQNIQDFFYEMGVVRIISTIKEKLEYWGKTCILLGYEKNHTGGTYCIISIHTKHIIIISDIIWINKTYGEYVSRKENTKAITYILQDEDESYSWSHVKKWSCQDWSQYWKRKKWRKS